MLVNRFLDRDRAGHRGARAQRRRRGTERIAGQVPQRQQRGRAHPPVGDQVREGVEVVLLLRLHVAQDVAFVAVAEHRELALVDALGAVLAGMVDADQPFQPLPRGRVAGQPVAGGVVGHNSLLRLRQPHVARPPASARANRKFICAMLTGTAGIR